MSENEVYPSMTQGNRLTKNGFLNTEEGSSDGEISDRSIFVDDGYQNIPLLQTHVPKNPIGQLYKSVDRTATRLDIHIPLTHLLSLASISGQSDFLKIVFYSCIIELTC